MNTSKISLKFSPLSSPKNIHHNSFSQCVYNPSLGISARRVTTYGALARVAGGDIMVARSISSILGKATNQRVIPWHRIIYAGVKSLASYQ